MQRRSLLLAAGAAAALPLIGRPAWAQAGNVVGAGSSLSGSVFRKWTELAGAGANLRVSYEGNGSTAGLDQLKSRRVDFASVDYPQRTALIGENQLIQFPTVISGVVPVVNLPGVADGQLRLTGELLADIFLGKITKWNDARIAEHNRDLGLPDIPVVPIYRTDPAGTNHVLTVYLSRVSEAWCSGPRAGTVVRWPDGGKTAQGIAGVAKAIKETPGAIGCSNIFTAKAQELVTVQLRNNAGNFVRPDTASFSAAAAAAEWTPQNTADAIDTGAPGAWPIVAPTFILLPSNPAAEKVQATLGAMKLFDWAYRRGAGIAKEMGYVPLPEEAQAGIRKSWDAVRGPDGKPVWGA